MLYLGQIVLNGELVAANLEFPGDEHVLTIGPTRSGKGRRLLVPNLIAHTDQSMIVVDPKGELATWTARHRSKKGSEIVILDPFSALASDRGVPQQAAGFNPLLTLDPASPDFVDDATGLAEALIKIEGNEPHWSASAQDLVAGLIMQVRAELGDAGSLQHVRRVLSLSPSVFEKAVAVACQNNLHPAIPGKLLKFTESVGNKELQSVLSTAQTQTRFLDSPPIQANLSKAGLDFGALKERPVTVYLVLPPARLTTHAKWLRLLIDAAIRALQRSPRNPSRPDVLFVLDEFPQLGRLESIETSMALNAGYGIKIWAIVQHLNQLVSEYGDNWETFFSGGVINAFAPRDVFTSKKLEELSGFHMIERPGQSISDTGGVTVSVSLEKREVMMAQEIRALPRGRMISFVPTDAGQKMIFTFARDFTDLPEISSYVSV
jgi:type IV secretion system protein VirD4